MENSARTLMKKLRLKGDSGQLDKCAALAFIWAASQVFSGNPGKQSVKAVVESVAPMMVEFCDSGDGVADAVGALNSLQRRDVWRAEPKINKSTIRSMNDELTETGVKKEFFEFIDGDRRNSCSVVSAALLKYFPDNYESLIQGLGLQGHIGSRLDSSLAPQVGDFFSRRGAISQEYGGNHQPGITRFDDGYVSVFSNPNGPYADEISPEAGWIDYVGEGPDGNQELKGGNLDLAKSQEERQPVRFWHKDARGYFFETWVVVVKRATAWGFDNKKNPRKEFIWTLAPVPAVSSSRWPRDVKRILEQEICIIDETEYSPNLVIKDFPRKSLQEKLAEAYENYKDLDEKARVADINRPKNLKVDATNRPRRGASARWAVIGRSGGTCESPHCLGHSSEMTVNDEPILEVDHLQDLALGGSDVPVNMVALCPNCHALKTRGKFRDWLKEELTREVEKRHWSRFY